MRVRTYTYVEPDSEAKADSEGVSGPDTLTRNPGSRPDFDAGFDAGYRAGYLAGYEHARKIKERDLAVEGAGESPSFLL